MPRFIVKRETFTETFSEKLFRCEKEQRNTDSTENAAGASTSKLHGPGQLKSCTIYGVLLVAVHPGHGRVTHSALAACGHQAR